MGNRDQVGGMNVTLEHGERFGSLTVLRRFKTGRGHWEYRLGCACGHQGTVARAGELMKGAVTRCYRCVRRAQP